MSSFHGRKRAPFGEAPVDVGNHRNPSPLSMVSKRFSRDPPPRAPVSSILVKNGVRSKSRSRGQQQQPEPHQLLPSPERTVGTADAHVNPKNDATRARVYKAEAYEAKIRIASQEQRIEALQNELEEVKFFAMVENEGSSSNADEREKNSKDDAELIEVLAQELETMEKDLNASQVRVGDLEKDLMDTWSKSEVLHWGKKEAALKKQLESQQRELIQAKKDVSQGMVLVKALDKELRTARAEKEDTRSQLSTLQSKMEKNKQDDTEREALVKELDVALKSMQNERDAALSSLRDEVEMLRECSAKCDTLEKSQIQSGKKMEQIKVAILEAHEREEKLKQDHENLVESYEQKVEDSEQFQYALEDLANQLVTKSAYIEELEDLQETNIANIKKEQRKNDTAISSLETGYAQEFKAKDDYLKSRESYWREELASAQTKNKSFEAVESNYLSEIASLKESVRELERSAGMEAPNDELISNLQMENKKLTAEKDDLVGKLQRGLEIHKRTTTELEVKSSELQNWQSTAAEDTNTLKKDYTSAVELSISRGKKMQLLEKDVEAYNSQLAKAVHKIKKLEKKSQPAFASNERLQVEVSSLRSKTRALEQELSLQSEKALLIGDLERDLASTQKANDESQSKIANLEEALRDMQVALKAVSSRKLSPHKSHSSIVREEKRRQIEDVSLAAYYAHRMQTEK